MAAGTWQIVNDARLGMVNNTINVGGGVFYAVLLTQAHVPNIDTDATYGNLTGQVTDPDYSRKDVNGMTATEVGGVVTVDSDDLDFGSAVTISAKYCYVIAGDANTPAAGDRVLCYVDLDVSSANPVSSKTGPFIVVMNAAGIFTLDQT